VYEQVFDGKRAYARKEAEIVNRELKSRLDLLAQSVKVTGPRVVVYNGLPWPRSGTVEVAGNPSSSRMSPRMGIRPSRTMEGHAPSWPPMTNGRDRRVAPNTFL